MVGELDNAKEKIYTLIFFCLVGHDLHPLPKNLVEKKCSLTAKCTPSVKYV